MNGSPALSTMLSRIGLAHPGDVRWAHGVNDSHRLAHAVTDPSVDWIEGDITLGEDGRTIMAHPPVRHSDLPFHTWIEAIAAAGKAAKLDFKSPSVVADALSLAYQIAGDGIPLIVNADLLVGPGGSASPFEPGAFLALCASRLPQALVSPGWRVGPGDAGYTQTMIDQMMELLEIVGRPVTVPVHAVRFVPGKELLDQLLIGTAHTLTLWGVVADQDQLESIRSLADPERTFADLQAIDRSQIDLFAD